MILPDSSLMLPRRSLSSRGVFSRRATERKEESLYFFFLFTRTTAAAATTTATAPTIVTGLPGIWAAEPSIAVVVCICVCSALRVVEDCDVDAEALDVVEVGHG